MTLLNFTTDTSAQRDVDLCIAIPQTLTATTPRDIRVIHLGTVAFETAA